MTERLFIFDTTLRDGEQVPGCQLNNVEKVEIARALESLGVDIIEAGFPISSPGDFNSVIEISKHVSNPVICALTRAVKKDIDVAADSLKYAKKKRIHTGIGVSPYHIKFKLDSTPADILSRAVDAVKYAKKFVQDVEFYAEDAGRSDNEYLAKVIEAVIKAGATVVNIPDTTGYCLPEQYAEKINFLKNNVPNIDRAIISTHCHNDLGLATANTIQGVINGARQIEVTINGVGERAGNTSLEEVTMILNTHKSLKFDTNINTEELFSISKLVSSLMNMPVQANKAIVGRNAFAHSSGIHQDGVLKNRENYEIIKPQDVGVNMSAILLTARSGKAALNHHLKRLGYDFDKKELIDIYDKFLRFADENKNVTEKDLLELLGKESQDNQAVKLELLQVISGKSAIPMATVHLNVKGEKMVATTEGNGPIDACFNAVNKIIAKDFVLQEYLVQAITKGSDDVGKVHVQIKHNNHIYYGFSANVDTTTASVEALVNAISKFV